MHSYHGPSQNIAILRLPSVTGQYFSAHERRAYFQDKRLQRLGKLIFRQQQFALLHCNGANDQNNQTDALGQQFQSEFHLLPQLLGEFYTRLEIILSLLLSQGR